MVNPLGSQDPKDFKTNVENLDKAVNQIAADKWVDRFGVDRLTWKGLENKVNAALERIAFNVPVDYEAGLLVNSNGFTVEYQGVIYAPHPSNVPFTTGAWDASKWYPIQNVFTQNNLLVFDDYDAAESAATFLPDGSNVLVKNTGNLYGVTDGDLYYISTETSTVSFSDYDDVREATVKANRILITGAMADSRRGKYGYYTLDVNDTSTQDNGFSVLVDASGSRFKREWDGVNAWLGWIVDGDGLSDEREKLQYAIDWLSENGGGRLQGDSGIKIGVGDTIYLKSNVVIEGIGSKPCIFTYSTIVGAIIQVGYTTNTGLHLLDPATNPAVYSGLINIEIDGKFLNQPKNFDPDHELPSGAVDAGLLYVWLDSHHFTMLDCDVHSSGLGIFEIEDRADYFVVNNNRFHDCTPIAQWTPLVNIDAPFGGEFKGNRLFDFRRPTEYPTGAWGQALRCHATDTCEIRHNRIIGGYTNLLVDGRNNIVDHNQLSGSENVPIRFFDDPFGCYGNKLVFNIVDCNGFSAFRETVGSTCKNNLVAFNTFNNVDTSSLFTIDPRSSETGNDFYDSSGNSVKPPATKYTPSPSSFKNNIVDGSIVFAQATYFMNERVVSVFGKVSLQVSAVNTDFDLRFSLPVAPSSNFSTDDLAVGNGHNTIGESVLLFANSGAKEVRVRGRTSIGASTTYYYSFSYII